MRLSISLLALVALVQAAPGDALGFEVSPTALVAQCSLQTVSISQINGTGTLYVVASRGLLPRAGSVLASDPALTAPLARFSVTAAGQTISEPVAYPIGTAYEHALVPDVGEGIWAGGVSTVINGKTDCLLDAGAASTIPPAPLPTTATLTESTTAPSLPAATLLPVSSSAASLPSSVFSTRVKVVSLTTTASHSAAPPPPTYSAAVDSAPASAETTASNATRTAVIIVVVLGALIALGFASATIIRLTIARKRERDVRKALEDLPPLWSEQSIELSTQPLREKA